MSDSEKKNHAAAIIFCIIIFVLPALTLYFTKAGLDSYKEMRSEMPFLKDSIRISLDGLPTYWDTELSNESIRDKMIFVSFWDTECQQTAPEVVSFLKKVQSNFNKEDQAKMLFVLQGMDHSQDSTWDLKSYVLDWKVDTSFWKFTKTSNADDYALENLDKCATVVLFDGRVSRKDTTGNYKNGPLLCEYYNIKEADTEERMLKHMAILMPKKERKKIEYKADEKLY